MQRMVVQHLHMADAMGRRAGTAATPAATGLGFPKSKRLSSGSAGDPPGTAAISRSRSTSGRVCP
eukprot:SAG31_NODE_20089_length_584_cov_0.746392_1_plen_65_part_00